jgi:hypothetical protein
MLRYNIDGKIIEVEFSDDIFQSGYNDGIEHMDRRFEDLSQVHDQIGKNPYDKNSSNYMIYKSGFIQGAS